MKRFKLRYSIFLFVLSSLWVLTVPIVGHGQCFRVDNFFSPQGSDEYEESFYIDTTADGGVIVCGIFGELDSLRTIGLTAPALHSMGSWDLFVTKIDSSGRVEWTNSFGTRSSDATAFVRGDMTVDQYGNTYILFKPQQFPSPPQDTVFVNGIPTHLTTGGGSVLLKFNAYGNLVRAVRASSEYALLLSGVVSLHGDVYLTGSYNSSFGNADFNGYTFIPSPNMADDAFVMKLDSGGAIRYVTVINSMYSQNPNKIAVGNDGSSYITGWYHTQFSVVGVDTITAVPLSSMSFDVFTLKCDTAGEVQWIVGLGSSEFDIAGDITTTDASVMFSGYQGYPTISNASTDTVFIDGQPHIVPAFGGSDIWVVSLDRMDGGLNWIKTFGTTTHDECHGIMALNDNAIAVVQISLSDTQPVVQLRPILEIFDSLGNVIFVGTYSGDNTPVAYGITASSRYLYTTGTFFDPPHITIGGMNIPQSPYAGRNYQITRWSIGSLQVNLGPDTTICSGASLILDAGNSGASYVWSTGDTTQTITITSSGTYTVTVTDVLGCQNTDSIIVSPCVATDPTLSDLVSVYPNPSTGTYKVVFPNEWGTVNATVYDLQGRVLATDANFETSGSVTVNAPAGIYLLYLQHGGESLTKKLILQH